MTEAERARVRQLVDELDRLVPRDGALVRLGQYGGGPDEGQFAANEAGYLRFGIEFLRGGLARGEEGRPGRSSATVELGYLVSDDSVIGFDEFIRDDNLRRGTPSPVAGGAGGLIGVGIGLGCIAALLALVGLGVVARWVARMLTR